MDDRCPDCVDEGYTWGPSTGGKMCSFHAAEAHDDYK